MSMIKHEPNCNKNPLKNLYTQGWLGFLIILIHPFDSPLGSSKCRHGRNCAEFPPIIHPLHMFCYGMKILPVFT
ncbi:hypothetical protein BFP76_00785 [Amylibacter kogurei]|uniref:Uncharacterized protein n=1 Tax=Paramylibacter kogurei TaxID=1889778 RepID=A0A2G5K9A0_9RHOB|nr:hypothetical protein BFP76_00785 [Amylibacter kogurei]